jgi:hypothetical protein
MSARPFLASLVAFAVLVSTAQPVWALGFKLGEAKEQLGLKYDVASVDHGTGRVTLSLTITDEGKLLPIDSVDLFIPGHDGSGPVDLSVSLATRTKDGKRSAQVHLKKELAERAEFHLKTWTLGGKKKLLTWYYYAIPLADYLKDVTK